MSRNRLSMGFVLTVVLALAVACSSAGAGSTEDLEKQVQTLTQRVEALEKELAAVKAAGAQAQPNAQLEQEANAALGQINQLVTAGKITEAKTQLIEFQKKYSATRAAGNASRLVQELGVIGKDAPTEWGIDRWFQGENDIDLVGKGATIVVFWETWCPHCRREVPKLQTMYETYGSQGLQVIGLTKITKSSTEEIVESFIAENKVGYPIAKENGQMSTYFGVAGIPAAAVVKDGQIVWRGHPARITEDMLKGWL
jgi:thioredoxin-like negative regulator of GroEL